jgi:hypothetical protein
VCPRAFDLNARDVPEPKRVDFKPLATQTRAIPARLPNQSRADFAQCPLINPVYGSAVEREIPNRVSDLGPRIFSKGTLKETSVILSKSAEEINQSGIDTSAKRDFKSTTQEQSVNLRNGGYMKNAMRCVTTCAAALAFLAMIGSARAPFVTSSQGGSQEGGARCPRAATCSTQEVLISLVPSDAATQYLPAQFPQRHQATPMS